MRTAEWCLPLDKLNRALSTVIQLAQDYAIKHKQYSLLPVYVRLAKTDDLFLSPASKFRPDGTESEHNCYIEVRKRTFMHTVCQKDPLPTKQKFLFYQISGDKITFFS